ncbi:MAG: HAMP domain-containing histidine kinase [Clostridia bacterium]|nr:HAMP domain-containing histidine kinase [Clostridia bacterium]
MRKLEMFLGNREFRYISLKIVGIFIAALICLLLGLSLGLKIVSSNISEQNQAMVGSILENHPELENDIVGIITNPPDKQYVEKGRLILEKYGYTQKVEPIFQPSISKIIPIAFLTSTIFIIGLLLILLLMIRYEYKLIYIRLREFSKSAERVVDGDFEIVIDESGEGDFARLSHCFNQMANRLKLSLEALKADKIFLKNIISDISHQLKTPLSSIIVFNELMQGSSMDNDTRHSFLEKTHNQLERIEWLVQSLLKVASLEAGSIVFKREKSELIEPIRSAVAAVGEMANSKGIDICINISEENIMFTGDSEWLAEALVNVIKNSIEHTHKGGKIEVRLSKSPVFSRITIKDNGEGIDERDLPRIFERFYKSQSSKKSDSVGIGLALTKGIVEGQGGTITVKSIRGGGSEFDIVFTNN